MQNEAYYFCEESADHVINFVESLKHYEDKFRGLPIILEPWQAFLLAMLYGWKKSKDGLRKHKKCYIQVARKAGKSILGAGIVLYHLRFGEAEEVYSIATKRDQAKLIYNKIKGIVGQVPNGEKYVTIHQNDIKIGDAIYTPMDAESRRADGFNPSLVIADEVHAMKNFDLIDVYQDGMGARSQPIMFMITTAGYSKGAAYEEYQRCKKVLSGEFTDETLLPMIFELDEGDGWEDQEVWGKSNPNLHVSVSLEYLQDQYNEATQKFTKEISFKTKNLNLWSTDSEETWISEKEWKLCNQEFVLSQLIGRRCYGGIDLAGVSDLTGYTLYFPLDNGKIVAIHKCYLPEETLPEKQRMENSNYYTWVRDKYVTATAGVVTDHKVLIDDLLSDAKLYDIIEIGYDPYKSGNIISFIEAEGLQMIPIKQGMAYFSEPCKSWERSVKDSQVIDNNPVMAWCMSNAVVKPDHHENIIPLKRDHKKSNKIDLVITSVIAHKVMRDNEDGLREPEVKENPLNAWAKSLERKNEDENTIRNENPLNAWAKEYLKNDSEKGN